MSNDELIGMIATAVLLGAAVGAITAYGGMTARRRADALSDRRADVYTQWLAARVTLTRASVSLVSSFRALAAEPDQSPNLAIRRDEAQRCRAAWSEAERELDRAEAALIVWCGEPDWGVKLLDGTRPTAGDLRGAIEGDEREVRALLARMRHADESATDFVRDAVARFRGRTALRRFIQPVASAVDRIFNTWGRL